jgi:hypothetical protein
MSEPRGQHTLVAAKSPFPAIAAALRQAEYLPFLIFPKFGHRAGFGWRQQLQQSFTRRDGCNALETRTVLEFMWKTVAKSEPCVKNSVFSFLAVITDLWRGSSQVVRATT